MPTTAAGYYFADGSTPMSAEDISAAEASASQTVFNTISARSTFGVADLDALAALATASLLPGALAYVTEGAVFYSWNGTIWVQRGVATFASTTVRDTAYAKASAAYLVAGVEAVDTSSGLTYERGASAWSLRTVEAHRQLDTTNSVGQFLLQHGIGKITGAGGSSASEAVTFPVAFATGTVPTVTSSCLGFRPTGSFNAVGLPSTAQSVVANPQQPSNTAFNAFLFNSGGNLNSSADFYYSWIAYGVAA